MKTMKKWMMMGVIAALAMSVQAGSIDWEITGDLATQWATGGGYQTTVFVILDTGTTRSDIEKSLRGTGTPFDGNNAGILGRETFAGAPTQGEYETKNIAVTNGESYDIFFLYLYGGTPLDFVWDMSASYSYEAGTSQEIHSSQEPIDVTAGGFAHAFSHNGKYTIAPGNYAVPEPLTAGLALAGVALLIASRKRK